MLRVKNSDAGEPQQEKIGEILKLLQLSFMERRIAESCLREEFGDTIPRGLRRRDMTQEPKSFQETIRGILDDYCTQEQYGEAGRLFKLLYALYASSLAKCIVNANSRFWRAMENGDIPADMSAVLTVYAHSKVPQVYMLSGHIVSRRYLQAIDLEYLAKFIRYDLRVVRKALKDYAEKYFDTKMILYTLYFYMRSSRVALNAGRSIWDSTHSLGQRRSATRQWAILGVKKRATEKDEPPVIIGPPGLDGTDRMLLRDYENVMVSALGQIFKPDATRDAVFRDIQNRIRLGQFPREQLPRLRGRAVNDAIFMLISGCAYANYRISQRLRGVVAVCGAAAPEEVLWMSHHMNEFACIEDGMDETFGIPVRYLIAWVIEWMEDGFAYRTAVDMDAVNARFRSQFRKYPSVYLDKYKKADYFVAHVMAQAIKEEDFAVYRREVLSRSAWQQGKVVDMLIAGGNSLPESRSYLEGRLELSALQAAGAGRGGRGPKNDKYFPRRAVEWYDETYHDEMFYARCMAYMALRECDDFFRYVLYADQDPVSGISMEQMTLHTFRGLDLAEVGLSRQFHIACLLAAEVYEKEGSASVLISCLVSVFQQYQIQRPQEAGNVFAGEGPYGRCLALLIYGREERQEEIFAYSLDNSKMVRMELERILASRPHWRPQVMELLSSKKAAQREMGIRVLARWDTPQDRAALWRMQEQEKISSVRSLLEEVLGEVQEREEMEEKGAEGRTLSRGELVKELHRGGRRRSLAWAYETPFSPVHRAGGGWAQEEYLQALLLCYSSMKEPRLDPNAALLAEKLSPGDLAVYMNELLDKWLTASGEAKKRWVVYAASIHGDGEVVRKLQHQISLWSRHSRGALAAEAVQALALSPYPMALSAVDNIARRSTSGKVRAAASQALKNAADRLGLTQEQLEDKMVPDLGFDEHMERHFDYGNRSFTVTLTPALEVEIHDGTGKRLKNMPAPGARDRAETAAGAYEDFKEMKKQLKTIAEGQRRRMERALATERLWNACAWRQLFVCNPVMHRFAMGLIWGVYEEHRLTRSFRYMEDGSFNTEREEEYVLPEQGQIGLVHPLELSGESLEAWKSQLEDYEITQPIEQLSRTVYSLTSEEQEGTSLERFAGRVLNDLSLGSRLTALGWQRGPVGGGGRYFTYYREEPLPGLGAELHFSGSIVGNGAVGGQDVTVRDVRFYRVGTVDRGPDSYDQAAGGRQLSLKNIPRRFFSEIVRQIDRATTAG